MNLIAGNWKMNKTAREAREFVAELLPLIKDSKEEVALCVPFTCLGYVREALGNSSAIKLGAQNVSWADKGAFTGEISADMLKEFGVDYVIIGHSERRQMFGDTDETVNARLSAALRHDISPILCVGETLETRKNGNADAFISAQLRAALKDIDAENARKITIAYEPIWAIGTGLTATPDQAGETADGIRETLVALYGKETADSMRILYGGSMNGGNAAELLKRKNINGGLIGGASLKPSDFALIVNHE